MNSEEEPEAPAKQHCALYRAMAWLMPRLGRLLRRAVGRAIRLPRPIIAILLILPLLILGRLADWGNAYRLESWLEDAFPWLVMMSLFAAGAVHRRRKGQIALMLALGALVQVAQLAVEHYNLLPDGYRPYAWLSKLAAIFVVLTLAESLLARLGWRVAAVAVVVALGAAAAFQVVINFVSWSWIPLSRALGDYLHSWEQMAFWAFAMILGAWTGVLLAQWSARRRLPAKAGVASLAAAAMLVHALFFGSWVFSLARASFQGHGPFSRGDSALLLETQGRHADYQMMLDAALAARSDPLLDDDGRSGWSGWRYGDDWLRTCIVILERNDAFAPIAAEAFAQQMLKEPSQWRVRHYGPLLSRFRHTETAPILFRYALKGDNASISALEQMDVREAALAEFLDEAKWAHLRPPGEDWAKTRTRLEKITGRKMPQDILAAGEEIDAYISQTPSNLPDAIQQDMDLEWSCLLALGQHIGLKAEAVKWIAAREQITYEYEVMRIREEFEPGPNYDVPTSDAFADEVDAYGGRVRQVIDRYRQKYGLDTQPATSPATQPGSSID